MNIKEIEFVFVQGGTFQMGSNENSAEKPIHSLTVSDFYIGKYEVTVAQFKNFIDATNYKTDADKENWSYVWNGSSWEKKNGVNWKCGISGILRSENEYSHPVVHVCWNDAQEFCKWTSEQTGKTTRLPTETEWEYVARGGNKSNGYTYSGSNSLDVVAWYSSNSGNSTHQVGTKQPNELGIYDMSGNVWEWCNDWYDANYYNISPAQNLQGPSNGQYRVLRGGSWNNLGYYCRVAYRYYFTPDYRDGDGGFRVAGNK
jgi:formylglycine-generating enzyme